MPRIHRNDSWYIIEQDGVELEPEAMVQALNGWTDIQQVYEKATDPLDFATRVQHVLIYGAHNGATAPDMPSETDPTSSPHGYHVFCNFRGDLMVYQGPHWSHWSNKNAGMLPDSCTHLFTLDASRRELAHSLAAMLNMRQGQLLRILTIYDQLMTALHISSDHAMLGEHVERIMQNNDARPDIVIQRESKEENRDV